MKEYTVAITITDVTSVDASSEEEALDIARGIFEENGYETYNADLDIISVEDK